MNLIEDIKVLAENCDEAKKYLELDTTKYCIKLIDYWIPSISDTDDSHNFHPNGECGCIELDDDYLFDIRCNHLMWATGYCEYLPGVYGQHSDSDFLIDTLLDNDVMTIEEWEEHPSDILIYGNHKGGICCKLLTCYINPDYLYTKYSTFFQGPVWNFLPEPV